MSLDKCSAPVLDQSFFLDKGSFY